MWPISKRGNKWEMLPYETWTDGRTMVCHINPVFWRAYKNEWPISWNYEYIIFGQIIFSKLSSVWLRRGCLFAWRTDGHNSGIFRRWMDICEWKHEYKVHRLHATWITDGHNSGVFRRWMEICEWKHEYKVHRLHATGIKPEVVATKNYTGYLHYRFITIGSRSLWSPCCSYMWVFLALVWSCQLFVRLCYRVSDVLDLSLVSKRFGFWPHITHVIVLTFKEI